MIVWYNFVVLACVPLVEAQGLHEPDHICFPLLAIIIEYIIEHNKYNSDFGV